MPVDPFSPQYLPFQIVNYLLAAVAYTLIGRVILAFFTRANPDFFLMRFFRTVTDPFIRLCRPITPRFMHPALVPLYVAFWVFVLRFIFGLAMLSYGLAPRLSGTA